MLKCVEDFRVYMTIWIIYDYVLHIYVQYTYLPWLAEVFSWTKSRGQTGFGFNGSNSIHLLRKVACMSTLVRNMVDDSGTDEEIPLPNASSSVVGNQKCLGFVMVAVETYQLKFADFEVKTAILSKVEMDVFKKREIERENCFVRHLHAAK